MFKNGLPTAYDERQPPSRGHFHPQRDDKRRYVAASDEKTIGRA